MKLEFQIQNVNCRDCANDWCRFRGLERECECLDYVKMNENKEDWDESENSKVPDKR